MQLKEGQWFMWSVDDPMPDRLTVFEGPVESPLRVTTISRYQAMALKRWAKWDSCYYCYQVRGGQFHDVYVVGDIDAWYGPETD
jgi:hypothetical protein